MDDAGERTFFWYMVLGNSNFKACVIAKTKEEAFEKLGEVVDNEDDAQWRCFDVALFCQENQVACFSQGGAFYVPTEGRFEGEIQ